MTPKPRFHTTHDPDAANRLTELDAVAEAIGMPLLPWVRDWLRVATEYDADTGIPRRRRTLATVPRQAGKSVAVGTVVIEFMLRNPGSFGVYLAQSRGAASNRLRDIAGMLFKAGLDTGAKVTLGVGNERLTFSNGGVMQVMSPNASAVHGESLDIAVMDEVFAIDPIVMQGISPAMSARPHAQLWAISTMGTLQDSDLLNGMVDQARDEPEGPYAFADYGLPEDVHPLDFDRYPEFHPGIGQTTTLDFIRDEFGVMPLAEATRAYGNVPTASSNVVVPMDWVDRAIGVGPRPDRFVLAVDRSKLGSSVVAAHQTEDGWHADLIDHQTGAEADWVPARVLELMGKYDVEALAYDPTGPAGIWQADLLAACNDFGVINMPRSGRHRIAGDMFLFERLKDEQVTMNDLDALRDSFEHAGSQSAGDGWKFSRRKAIVDPSPVIACAMAVYAAHEVHVLHPKPAVHW